MPPDWSNLLLLQRRFECGPGSQGYNGSMFGKNLLFYIIASTVIAVIAQLLGANIGVVLFASFLGPPVILLTLAVLHYNGWL